MKSIRVVSGILQTNSYIVYDENEKVAYLIDPEDDAKMFLDKIESLSLQLKGIILTHHHYDHRGAAEGVIKATGCKLYIHELEKNSMPMCPDSLLKEKNKIIIGSNQLVVLHTPGHTRGSICLYCEDEKIAFTGDTIFNVDLGRTDLEDGSPKQMSESIKNIISKWNDEIIIYPGHGDPCSMAYVRENNWEYKDIVNSL